jgi:Peptidase C13 family
MTPLIHRNRQAPNGDNLNVPGTEKQPMVVAGLMTAANARGETMAKFRFRSLVAGVAMALWFAGALAQPAHAQRFTAAEIQDLRTRQTDLVLSALEGVQESRPGRVELYALTFASFASQDVFKRESASVKDILDGRFGTKGRSLLLLNHRSTYQTGAMATVANLRLALQGIGERMDTSKDVLLLFITTHGSPGVLSVEFPGLRLKELDPVTLNAMLDEAGIKHRVLVISACFSGSFLPALSDPDTLVMTAARADRTSFGCSNEREWTYFGDALFNRALRTTYSFTDAFKAAKTSVSTWETAAKLLPSEPQMALGARIGTTLAKLQKQLEATQ